MKTTFTTLKLPVIISLALVLPFLVMELINRREFHEDFPFSLFIGLWLLPLVFFLILTPMVQRVREGRKPMENPVDLVFGILVMLLVAVMWINLLSDQMPCFLGVMNCD